MWRWFSKWPRQLRLVALAAVALTMLITMAPTRSRPRHPDPHPTLLPPMQPLRTGWNLTCPTPEEAAVGVARVAVPEASELPPQQAVPCSERGARPPRERRGAHLLLRDWAPAALRPPCWAAVTLATHGDLTYLGALGPLVRRWRAPVSLALFAPGADLEPTARAVAWARACVQPPLVAQHVSFHLLLHAAHLPGRLPPPPDLSAQEDFNCSAREAPWLKVPADGTYRWQHGLSYPVNVARNMAREMARTHFVLVSDMELLPSTGLSDAFLAMVRRKMTPDTLSARRVFVLPVFEVQLGVPPPEDKPQLVAQLRAGKAAPFHEQLCAECHAIPRPQRWVCAPKRTDGALGVTAIARRQHAFRYWEPIFIGTHHEPLYDERLSWEGMNDKQVQGYTMCLLDYKFYVLDDAFLVHQPGVKAKTNVAWRAPFMKETRELLKSAIKPELTMLYGHRSNCYL